MSKLKLFLAGLLFLPCVQPAAVNAQTFNFQNPAQANKWKNYNVGKIIFEDKAPSTEGSKIYHRIVTDPKKYIAEQARMVLSTLYFTPKDSIPKVKVIHYTLEDIDGISAKDGNEDTTTIFYSTRHIAKSFAQNDTAKLFFETRGVLLHELTHAYQLAPQGIGDYGSNKTFWAFIEGMADAVRVSCGGFHEGDRPKGGNYNSGYRTTGYFLAWVAQKYDKNFLRKFNQSTLHVIPWSFDGGVKYALGKKFSVEKLWHEYQVAVGDIKK